MATITTLAMYATLNFCATKVGTGSFWYLLLHGGLRCWRDSGLSFGSNIYVLGVSSQCSLLAATNPLHDQLSSKTISGAGYKVAIATISKRARAAGERRQECLNKNGQVTSAKNMSSLHY